MAPSILNILLVEDNNNHAELIVRCLKLCNKNHMIHHVSDGEEAIKFMMADSELAQNSHDINLILLDLRIPKIDGIQVLKKIKAQTNFREIPVVILSSSNAEADKINAYQNFANSYLVKPIGFNEFKYLMKRVDEYWSKCNQSVHLN